MPINSRTVLWCLLWCLFCFQTAGEALATLEHVALKQGMSGKSVSQLQIWLTEFGYYQGSIDGKFGSDTLAAVINFQISNNLYPDGIVGAATLKAMRDSKKVVNRSEGEMSRKRQKIAAFAIQYLGVPYTWAGRSPNGFDCSGFIHYVFGSQGIIVPRMANEQFQIGIPINKSELQTGDLVFFTTYEPGPSHVGIFIGNGYFIHASSGAEEVTITPLSKPYYQERYLGARRIIR